MSDLDPEHPAPAPDVDVREDDVRVGDVPTDDLDERHPLLGASWSDVLGGRTLQGAGLVLGALVVLLWPEPTNRVLGRLGGLALAWLTITLVVDVVRHPERRRFPQMIAIAVASGLSASLLVHPEESLTSVVQAAAIVAAVQAARVVVAVVRERRSTAWRATKVLALLLVGALVWEYPIGVLDMITSIGAMLVAATGFIWIFHRPEDGDGSDLRLRSTLLDWIRRRPDMAEDRDVLRSKLYFEGPDAPVRFARFCALMAFAAVIASIGVIVESTAVVIGAMLIAPLMVPLMGTALSVTMGWPRRMRRCLSVAGTGIVIAISTGAVLGAISTRPVDVTSNTEILARVSPTAVDLAIAVAAGAAGAYALARRDVSDSLPGVAVAIALVPPLTVVGLCWQAGAFEEGSGALLLFLTNAMAILVAGGATFVLVGTARLERVSESQRRLRTAIVALLAMCAVVIYGLIFNGQDLARAELSRAGVDRALAEWSSEHPDYKVVDNLTRSDGTIVVDLAGPGEPPDLDRLLEDLRGELGSDVELEVRWVEMQQKTVSGGD